MFVRHICTEWWARLKNVHQKMSKEGNMKVRNGSCMLTPQLGQLAFS